MINEETPIKEKSVFQKVGNTMYEIIIKESDNAKESAEDVLARFVSAEMETEETNG